MFALGLAAWTLGGGETRADGTCRSHYPYKVLDGHGHDGDGDGVGCESNPLLPGQSATSDDTDTEDGSATYDRDNWDYRSSTARSRLGCTSAEHVDHIVALREAYDSGGSAWSPARKREFANDPLNQWCLAAGVNRSKSDRDLAEWEGGACGERKFIAMATIAVKLKYQLATDLAEQRANVQALAAACEDAVSVTRVLADAPPDGGSGRIGSDARTVAMAAAAQELTAETLYDGMADYGVAVLWKWTRSAWIGYAEAGDAAVPGAVDFAVRPGDVLIAVYRSVLEDLP